MSKYLLYCASVVLIAAVYGCQPAGPKAGSAGISSAGPKPGSPANGPSGKELWNLPDTDKPVIIDKPPTAASLAEQTKEYADRMEKAGVPQKLTSTRHGFGAQGDVQPVDGARNPKAAPNSGADTGEPSKVKFGNAGEQTAQAETPAASAGPQKASANQLGSTGGANDISTTVTPGLNHADPPINKDTPVPNAPLLRGQPAQLPSTDELAQRLYKGVKDYPQDPASQLDYQMMLFVQNQSVPQMQTLSAMSGEDREMLTTLLDGLTNFRNALRADNNMLLSRKIRPVLEIADRLRMQAELTIPTLALCTDVKGFGSYEPIEPARFEAGKEHKVVVYCEVENFSSTLNPQKQYETRLMQDVVLYAEGSGLEVWRDKTQSRPIVDFSRKQRHDFFIVKMIRLPSTLSLGRYILKVSVVDQQVKRVAENTAAIQVVAE